MATLWKIVGTEIVRFRLGKLGVERIAFRVQLRIKVTRGILDFRVLLTRCPTCPLPITAPDEDDSGKLGKNPSASNQESNSYDYFNKVGQTLEKS